MTTANKPENQKNNKARGSGQISTNGKNGNQGE